MMAKMILQMSLDGLAVRLPTIEHDREKRTPRMMSSRTEEGTYEAVKGMVTVERKRMGRERNAEMYFKRELRPHYITMRHCGYAQGLASFPLPSLFPVFPAVFCCLVDLYLGSDPNCLHSVPRLQVLKKKRHWRWPNPALPTPPCPHLPRACPWPNDIPFPSHLRWCRNFPWHESGHEILCTE